MFEKLAVDIINRALGDYVENLDASQLNLSIWRGDVQLENLNIKGNALDALEIPIEVKQGHLGKLVLKIPWKHLYTEPTVAEIDGLYVLAVPKMAVSYDPKKEFRFEQESKMKKVRQFEEARRRAALTEAVAEESGSADLGFTEKLILQVVKNLQVRVKNVHIRYEDRVTCPERPFTAGVCMQSFSFQTTDPEWKPTTLREQVTQLFHKLLDLNCLSVYWNSFAQFSAKDMAECFYSDMFSQLKDKARVQQLLEAKMCEMLGPKKPKVQYMLEPISAQARFRYEAFPEQDNYANPQIWLDLDFKELSIKFSKEQYTTLVVFGDSIDRIVTMNKYRKYRLRSVGQQMTSREKWRFAYKVVHSEVVQRRRNMWRWDRIRAHRQVCRAYTAQYMKLLKKEKYDADLLERHERDLDAFSIIMCRQLAESMVKKEKAIKKDTKSKGWFGGWFGSSKQQQEESSILGSVKEEFNRMSAEEREQLYSVVNYKENAPSVSSYPPDYRAKSLRFNLSKLNFLMHNNGSQIVRFELQTVEAQLGQYPASGCTKVEADVCSLAMWGCESDAENSKPCMISTLPPQAARKSSDSSQRLFRFTFELNPFEESDAKADKSDVAVNHRIRVVANPLEIIYDAETVIRIVDFVEPSEEIRFRELSAVLMTQLENVKDMTATGLKHIVEQHTYTDIRVDLRPSHFILPETGRYRPGAGEPKRLLVFDLGELSIRSEPPSDVSQLNAYIDSGQRVLDFEKIKNIAYDRLDVRLSSMQLLFVDRGVNWLDYRRKPDSGNHLLRPLALQFELYKCMVATDPRLSKVKIIGQLPKLALEINDTKTQQLIQLAGSIQFPESKPASKMVTDQTEAAVVQHDVLDPKYRPSDVIDRVAFSDEEDDDEFEDALEELDSSNNDGRTAASPATPQKSLAASSKPAAKKKKAVNLKDVEIHFNVNTVIVELKKDAGKKLPKKFLEFNAMELALVVMKRTYDLSLQFCVRAAAMLHHEHRDPHASDRPLEILSSEAAGKAGEHLVRLAFTVVERGSPFLHDEFNSTLQSLQVDVETVQLKMHKESLLEIIGFAQTLLPLLEELTAQQEFGGSSDAEAAAIDAKSATRSVSPAAAAAAKSPGAAGPDVCDMLIAVNSSSLQVFLCEGDTELLGACVHGVHVNVGITKRSTSLSVLLQDFVITSGLLGSVYDTVVWVHSKQQVFKLDVRVNNLTAPALQLGSDEVDVEVEASLAKINCLFLHVFIVRLLNFFDSFQAAKEQMMERAQQLKETAKEKAVESSNLKMKLDVRVEAPAVVIPESSESTAALWADLGRITASNAFSPDSHEAGEAAKAVSESGSVQLSDDSLKFLDSWRKLDPEQQRQGQAAIWETMRVQLEDVKVLHTSVQPAAGRGISPGKETLLMRPFEFGATMRRCLGDEAESGPTGVVVCGSVGQVQLRLSQSGYHLLLRILLRNLGEGQRLQAELSSKSKAAKAATDAAGHNYSSAGPAAKSSKEPTPGSESSQSAAVCSVQFYFSVRGLALSLYTDDEQNDSGQLGECQVHSFFLGGHVMSDNSMRVLLQLGDLSLTDKRPGYKTKINQIMHKRIEEDDEKHKKRTTLEPLVHMSMNAATNGDQNVSVTVASVYLCVDMGYLKELAQFFAPPEMPSSPPAPAAGGESQQSEKSPNDEAQASHVLWLRVNIQRPELLLVEDLSDENCNAVVLSLRANMDYTMDNCVDNCNIVLDDVQVFCCPFNEKRRHQSYFQVISPCSFSVAYHSVVEREASSRPQKQTMAVINELLLINISPPVIQTLVRISSVLTADEATSKVKSGESQQGHRTYEKKLWEVKSIEDQDFSFLHPMSEHEDVEVGFDVGAAMSRIEEDRKQEMQIDFKQIKLIFNIDAGNRTVPMLILESTISGQMTNWSANSELSLNIDTEMAYYNEPHDCWEPFLEPVDYDGKLRPYQLCFQFIVNQDPLLLESDSDAPTLQPKTVLIVTSDDPLELTLTRTSLSMLNTLSKEFNEAYNLKKRSRRETDSSFVLRNCLGELVVVGSPTGSQFRLGDGEEANLQQDSIGVSQLSVRELQAAESSSAQLVYQLPRLHLSREVTLHGTESRGFKVPTPQYPGGDGAALFVSQARCYLGTKSLVLRSNVGVHNESSLTVWLETKSPDDTPSWRQELEPGDTCHVPLLHAAEARHKMYFSPGRQRPQPVAWDQECGRTLSFDDPDNSSLLISFNVAVKHKEIFLETDTEDKNGTDYVLTVLPAFNLVNQLPMGLTCIIPGEAEETSIERGSTLSLYRLPKKEKPQARLRLHNYLGVDWNGTLQLESRSQSQEDLIHTVKFSTTSAQFEKKDLMLSARLLEDHTTKNFTIFSSHWLVNKTGKFLYYKSPDGVLWQHPDDCNVTMMNLSANLSEKEKITLKVEDSAWSTKFPLDTVGHAGTVKCKTNKLTYQVGVNITVGSNGITKIVTFIPFFSVVNKSPLHLEVAELPKGRQDDRALDYMPVPRWEATPFWPTCEIDKSMQMRLRVNGSKLTDPFPITDSGPCVLPLRGSEFGGVLVEVALAQEACVVTVQQYQPGYAPLQIVNALPPDYPEVELRQKSCQRSDTLRPGTCLLYSWADARQERQLEWKCGQFSSSCRTIDSYEKGNPLRDKDCEIYVVCFLHGCQRVLLFTNDLNMSCSARLATMFERVEVEFKVSLMGLGISLVDNKHWHEVAYISVRSPGVQWYETRKSGLLRPMKKGLSDALETVFVRYQLQQKAATKTRVVERVSNIDIEVDFGKQPFQLVHPKECLIERQYDPALFLSFKTSEHNLSLSAKVAKLQIDSMMPTGIYQIFFYQVPPPKSVAEDQVPKAFINASVVVRRLENDVMQVQYCKMLVQEFEIKLDQVFLDGLLEMVGVLVRPTVKETQENFLADCRFVEASLIKEQLANLSDSGKKHFIDQLHLSPIKINLSFSLSSSDGGASANPFVNLAVATVLGSVARCSDALIQLNCLQRENTSYSTAQLIAEVQRHYTRQFYTQLYKVFLGIDLLGNPLSVIGGIRSGAQDFFYEPIAGAIQGPEEFVEGVFSGMKSFVGHTVGGLSGFLQRMTGTVGHLAAVASFDQKYQRQREARIRSRANYGAGSNMAKAAHNLGLGFVQGISGIVTQPIEGGREKGATGFISGMGKGLVGVVSRPVGAVVDFASDTFYSVQRAADLSEVPRRVRDPRYIRPESRLTPYRAAEAEGFSVLQAMRPLPHEVYGCHCCVADARSKPAVALVTNCRFILAKKADLLATWSMESEFFWEAVEDVRQTAEGFELVLKAKKKKALLSIKSAANETVALRVLAGAAKAMVAAMRAQLRASGSGSLGAGSA